MGMSALATGAFAQTAQVHTRQIASRMGHRDAPFATVASRSQGSSVRKTCANVPVALLQLEWIVLHKAHPNALHAILVSPKLTIRVWRTNANVVMAQPQPVRIAHKLVLSNACHATRVSQMLGILAPDATRTLVALADGCLAMVGVAVLLVTLRRTDACALLDIAMSTESAEHLLIVPKSRAFHAFLVRAMLVSVTLLSFHLDIARAIWNSVLWETVASIPLSRWPPTFRQCNRWRDRPCSVVTSLVPVYFSQVLVQWHLWQGSSVVVAMMVSS